MEKSMILDCTLRDGGYYTNWDFSIDLIKDYFKAVDLLPVDYVELGYRNKPKNEYFGEFFFTPIYLLELARKLMPNTGIAIMFNEKDVEPSDIEELLNPCIDFVDLVRFAVAPDNIGRSISKIQTAKAMGFKVALNVMYASKWLNERFDQLEMAAGEVDFFYVVDSYGASDPDEIQALITRFKAIYKDSIIGFHSHNNLEMALPNTIQAIKSGAGIVDATIMGIGRGAGNLKTELLLTYLESKKLLKVDFEVLSNIIEPIKKLQDHYQWGTSLPYMISGANSLPQKDVMDFIQVKYFSISSVVRALRTANPETLDDTRYPLFNAKGETQYKKILIVGGGQSVSDHAAALNSYISKNEDEIAIIFTSTRNARSIHAPKVKKVYCFLGNEGMRFEREVESLDSESEDMFVLPPSPRLLGTYVPKRVKSWTYELGEVSFTEDYRDSSFALSLQAAINLNPDIVYLAGFDGYKDLNIGEKEKQLIVQNEHLIARFAEKCKLISFFPTNYTSLPVSSLYQEFE